MKKQLEQKKLKKKKDKEERKQERHENSVGGKLEDMIMYVDEHGNFSSTPPEKKKE
ncbi:cold-shock protein [Rufibacter aurantiacus]|nr:cold-shock protein [Rufibacter aurantiacus]